MPYLTILPIILYLHGLTGWFDNNPIQGEVYNAKTKESIPYVNIWIKAKDIHLTCNSEGKFIFPNNPSFYQDTIVFSSIGYKPSAIPLKQLLEDKKTKKSILLQEDIYPLQEVAVRPLTARQIVEKGIEHIPENHLNINHQIKGFYRKAIKENNAFASLVESIVQITDTGNDKKKFGLSYLKSRFSKDYRAYQLPPDQDVMAKVLEQDHIRYRRGFLNIYNLGNWQFKIVGHTKIEHKEVYIIQASLLGNKKTANHQAKIYIRAEDYAFQKIDYDYNWDAADLPENSAPWDTLIFKKYNWKGSFSYVPFKGKMVLNYFHFVLKQNVYLKKYIDTDRGSFKTTKFLASQESHEEFIVDEIKATSQTNHTSHAVTAFSLSESAKSYDEMFWRSYLKPVDTKLFLSIKKDLEKYAPLEDLFELAVP